MISAVKLSDLCGQSVRRRAAYSPKDYELIYELYFKNRSEKEYAQMLGVSQQAIHVRKKRILKKIKNNLDEQGC